MQFLDTILAWQTQLCWGRAGYRASLISNTERGTVGRDFLLPMQVFLVQVFRESHLGNLWEVCQLHDRMLQGKHYAILSFRGCVFLLDTSLKSASHHHHSVFLLLLEMQQKLRTQIFCITVCPILGANYLYTYLHPLSGADEAVGSDGSFSLLFMAGDCLTLCEWLS